MSAILGGSTTISNISYDSIYHKSNEFGERISRNQLLILKEEAYLSGYGLVELIDHKKLLLFFDQHSKMLV